MPISHAPSVIKLLSTMLLLADEQLADVSIEALSKQAAISRRSTSRALAELEKTEVIRTVWQRTGRRGGKYTVLLHREQAAALLAHLTD